MRTIKLWGASDDLVEVEDGHGGGQEHGGFEGTPNVTVKLTSAEGAMYVHAFYGVGPGATWCFAVDMLDEGVPLPGWPVRIVTSDDDRHASESYSTRLEIDVPDDTDVTRVDPKTGKPMREDEE